MQCYYLNLWPKSGVLPKKKKRILFKLKCESYHMPTETLENTRGKIVLFHSQNKIKDNFGDSNTVCFLHKLYGVGYGVYGVL